MSDLPAPAPPRRRRGANLAWLLVLALLVLVPVGFVGWQRWNATLDARTQAAQADRQRIESLEERVASLRRDQRAQTARLQQAEATNRLLREELIGLGQRAALLEESVQRLADPERNAAQALRLDEVELLLAQGQQRLQLAGDADGARRAYALAAQLLDGVADPAWLDLRQALAQERAALEALGEDPKALAAGRLEAFAAALPALPRQAPAADPAPAWWERAFSKVVDVRPSAAAVAVDPADRAAGLAALQLELTLAQAAIERRDEAGYRAALARADGWLLRLWPDSAERVRQRRALQALRERPLTVELPALGSTLVQLRRQRSAR
ncbi:uroporphyrinogen-III C-methyltransferase [Luteimonas saliphila]|uniref:uroporphyrinogen-III C-methyltransferase n=1 Tax=Luteimonas saliphila TaxID=2804919 RepID=UPI00192D6BB3|nr:uroporphyrinogen-III C-methyltransferase [Luteimonas saliphila]